MILKVQEIICGFHIFTTCVVGVSCDCCQVVLGHYVWQLCQGKMCLE